MKGRSMDPALGIPPESKDRLTPPATLCARLEGLIGRRFPLTKKTRTDGANARKFVAAALSNHPLPPAARDGYWRIVPAKGKGVPRILREFVDTYLVTSGTSYNLQVWNRNPSTPSVQVEIDGSAPLRARDVRFVFLRVRPREQKVASVLVLSPGYIVKNFGPFGHPTVKQQLIITDRARREVLSRPGRALSCPDDPEVRRLMRSKIRVGGASIRDRPAVGNIIALDALSTILRRRLLGRRVPASSTKERGQWLERFIAEEIGYSVGAGELLMGGYPDLLGQALEVKVQDSPTVDLGRFSPEFVEPLPACPPFTTGSVRYVIALTNPRTGRVEGLVTCPGNRLGNHFSFVAGESFKCQRAIPMAFFDRHEGKAVSDP